jgi:hypothetical protein
MNILGKQTLFLGILILVAAGITMYMLSNTQEAPIKEGFAETPSNADDSDIQISMCPQATTPLQNGKGDTDCCDGEIVDFKCRKNLVCTLSPTHDGIPTCVEYLKKYLREKAIQQCPTKFPRYWEDKKTNTKGCVAGKRLPDGTGPKDTPTFDTSCKIQATDQENRNTYGSCFNAKYNEQMICPERSGLGSQRGYHGAWWQGSVDKVPNLHFCRPVNEMRTYDLCYDDATLKLWWDAVWPGWRNWLAQNPWWKQHICSIYKQLRIDKTITDAQLKDIQFA